MAERQRYRRALLGIAFLMAGVALLAAGCTRRDPVADEIACQKRLVAIPAARDVAPQGRKLQGMPAAFEAMSRRYAAMDLGGCTEDQRIRAKILVGLTHELAVRAARLPTAQAADDPSPRRSQAFLAFLDGLEQFEQRRIVMQRDLDRMEAVRLR